LIGRLFFFFNISISADKLGVDISKISHGYNRENILIVDTSNNEQMNISKGMIM